MKWVVGVVAAALAVYPVLGIGTEYHLTVAVLCLLLAVQAVSWNILSGYAGYVSLGHSAFLGIGAYLGGIAAERLDINPLLAAPLGGVLAAGVAVAIGAVVLRSRGAAFVIVTIALLLTMQVLATNLPQLTHGNQGLAMPLPPWSRDTGNLPFYYLFLALLALTLAFSAWIRTRKLGSGLIAIREDEGKAAAIGIPTTRYKVTAYASGAFFTGVAGGIYGYFLSYISPTTMFAVLASVMVVLAALLGGRGSLYGPVVGAFVVAIGSEAATVYGGGSSSRLLLFGALLTGVVLFLPQGLLPGAAAWWRARHPRTVEYTDQEGALGRLPPVRASLASGSQAELLRISGVSKRFGGLVAVDGADLVVRRGTITGLIGPNGSGKTTLFNLVTGTLRADAGEITFEGRHIDRMPPWERCHLGLGRTFQTTRLFHGMSVLENVVAPLPDGRWRTAVRGGVTGAEARRARELLDFMGLGRFAAEPAGSLSYGQQKLVELAQILMLDTRLILLDEPAGGINPALVEHLKGVIRQLADQGVTFLLVEHNIPLVLDLCDPVVVFSQGRTIAEGPPGKIRDDPAVLEAYLGDPKAERKVERPC
ncbi:ABC transporter permease subunit [Streptomyces fulvoviolaceus]|uniref:branched-chain amino acid ABC transporter ATP-binding protein/permease n=1 Tax=Streptomyces fulvoviolaceus TaxID=285535 RepID=UPI0005BCE59A|nr:branched-chain amino acid ABC transporter ATP-binding protein/permease [Streptomyces fulvoviolaceus]